jgi:Flp pilus assembly protein TadG
MNPPRPSIRRALRPATGVRRGVVVGMLLVAMLLLVGLMGLAWNVSQLAYARGQLRTACEAAALAGAAELMDEDVLRTAHNQGDDVAAARLKAQQYAATNVSHGRPVVLDLNVDNDPRGDIVIGWVDQPGVPGANFQPWQGTGPINTIRVTASRRMATGNPIALWSGRLLGITHGAALSVASATLDNRIYGFRTRGAVCLPLVPLAAECQSWLSQATTPAASGGNDQYSVDYTAESVASGSDGIPEIELRAALSSSSSAGSSQVGGNFVPLVLEQSGEDARQRQLRQGLATVDLLSRDGEFSMNELGQLLMPTAPGFDATWVEDLLSIQGVSRVWPLGEPSAGGYQITGFGAAVVVNAWIDTQTQPPQLVVAVQPALLVTNTALAGPGASFNPWIAKLMLTE